MAQVGPTKLSEKYKHAEHDNDELSRYSGIKNVI